MARRSKSQLRYDKFSALRSRMVDIYRKHIQLQSTHDRLSADVAESIYNHPHYRKLTIGQRDCLREVRTCWSDRIWELHVDWRLGTALGPIVRENFAWTPQLSVLCRIPGALYGGHYWRGSDRLYTQWASTNGDRARKAVKAATS